MDLSPLQPAAGPDSISALFLPTDVAADATQNALFGSILGDALAENVVPDSAVQGTFLASRLADAAMEDQVTAQAPGPFQSRDGGRKRPETKNDSADHREITALCSLLMAPAPVEPLQQLNQSGVAPASNGQFMPTQQVSGAPTCDAVEKGTQPESTSQMGRSAASGGNSVVRFQALTNVKQALAPDGSPHQGLALDVRVENSPHIQDGRSVQAGKNVPEDSTHNVRESNTNGTDGPASSSTQDDLSAIPTDAAQLLSHETEVNAATANSAGYPLDSTAGIIAAGSAVTQLQGIALSLPPISSSVVPSDVLRHVPRFSRNEKPAASSQAPVSEAQSPSQDGQPAGGQKSQPAISGFIDSSAGSKSAVLSVPTHLVARNRTTIKTAAAGTDSAAKADTGNVASASATTATAVARNTDRKPAETQDQSNSPSQNLAPTTPAPVAAQAAVAPAAGSQNPASGSVPVTSSQPIPISSAGTSAVKPALHDLPAPAPDAPAASIHVHTARIMQADSSRAEMRLGMQTQAFGALEVHASVSGKDVQFAVTSEHGDLRSFLAPEVPVLQNNLQQHDLRLQQVRTVLSTEAEREFSPGSERHEQRYSRPQQQWNGPDQHNVVASLDEEEFSNGLNIRI